MLTELKFLFSLGNLANKDGILFASQAALSCIKESDCLLQVSELS
jgi:hypothetical protein